MFYCYYDENSTLNGLGHEETNRSFPITEVQYLDLMADLSALNTYKVIETDGELSYVKRQETKVSLNPLVPLTVADTADYVFVVTGSTLTLRTKEHRFQGEVIAIVGLKFGDLFQSCDVPFDHTTTEVTLPFNLSDYLWYIRNPKVDRTYSYTK